MYFCKLLLALIEKDKIVIQPIQNLKIYTKLFACDIIRYGLKSLLLFTPFRTYLYELKMIMFLVVLKLLHTSIFRFSIPSLRRGPKIS